MYARAFGGMHVDPRIYLRKTFEVDHEEMVCRRTFDFPKLQSITCCHSWATSGLHPHRPRGWLSKLARVVDAVARRPQIQERMTQEIADLLHEELAHAGCSWFWNRPTPA